MKDTGFEGQTESTDGQRDDEGFRPEERLPETGRPVGVSGWANDSVTSLLPPKSCIEVDGFNQQSFGM